MHLCGHAVYYVTMTYYDVCTIMLPVAYVHWCVCVRARTCFESQVFLCLYRVEQTYMSRTIQMNASRKSSSSPTCLKGRLAPVSHVSCLGVWEFVSAGQSREERDIKKRGRLTLTGKMRENACDSHLQLLKHPRLSRLTSYAKFD